MALQTFPAAGMIWPSTSSQINTAVGASTAATLNAAGEIAAMCGRVWWPNRADLSKELTYVHVNMGGVGAFGGSSQWRVSIQDVDLTNGPPIRPDGVVDQSFISSAGVGPTPSAWNRVALSANRTVAFGELLAVVVDYEVFTAGDSIIVRAASGASTLARQLQGNVVDNTTGSWVEVASHPIVLLEFSDGTFGTLFGSAPLVSLANRVFNNTATGSGGLTTGNQRGLEFVAEFDFKADSVYVDLSIAAGADFQILAVEGTSTMTGGTITVDSNAVSVNASSRRAGFPFTQELTFIKGTTYRILLVPTTANSITLNTITLNSADHRVIYGGLNFAGNSRTDAGAFGTPITTELPLIALGISSIDYATINTGAYTLSGEVLIGASPVEGALVTVVDRTTRQTRTTSTDVNGAWSVSVESNAANRYAAYVEYETGGNTYSALAPWAITAA